MSVHPRIVKRLSERLVVACVEQDQRMWSTGILRKYARCTLCSRAIPVKTVAWKEITGNSIYRAARVCIHCWSITEPGNSDEPDEDEKTNE